MKHIIVWFVLSVVLFAKATFITQMEYASSLYKNPRGIGCQKCHGVAGEGKVIANYVHKGKKRSFVGPAIKGIPFKKFYKALNRNIKGMPRYYLTYDEIKALYLYLHRNDKKVKKDAQ